MTEWCLQLKSIITTVANLDANILYVLLCFVLSCISSLTSQKRWDSSGHFIWSLVCPLRHLICVSLIGLPATHQARKQLVSAAFPWSVMAAKHERAPTAALEVAVQLQSPGSHCSFAWEQCSSTLHAPKPHCELGL